jgi:hypothetical protein
MADVRFWAMDARERRVLRGEVTHEVLEGFRSCPGDEDPVRPETDRASDDIRSIFYDGEIAVFTGDRRRRTGWSGDAQEDDVLHLGTHKEGLGAIEKRPGVAKTAHLHLLLSG